MRSRMPSRPNPLVLVAQSEPVAVVADGELNRVGVLEDFDHRPVGVAVLGGVGQRLLGDPVERGFELGGVPCRLAAPFVCDSIELSISETVPSWSRFRRGPRAQPRGRADPMRRGAGR